MRPRTLKLVVEMGLGPISVAEAKITNFCKVAEVKDFVDRVCPICGKKPQWHPSSYTCCGQSFSTWQALREVVKGTSQALVKAVLLKKGEPALARLWRMSRENFKQYADATLAEYGLTVKDSQSASNMRKLLIAVEKLSQVIILTWNEEYEQKIALLGVTESSRIVVREIVPLNMGQMEETLRATMDGVTEKEIQEAQQFVKTLPEATGETLTAHDWRAEVIPQIQTPETTKVQDLEAILAKAKEGEAQKVAVAPTIPASKKK